MEMKKLFTAAAMLIAVAGCSEGRDEEAKTATEDAGRPLVHTTNYPLKYFAERISAPVVDVRFLVPGGEDPAYWKPDPEDVLAMQKADLIVLNGASYETWLENVSLPRSRMVVTADGLRDRLIPLEAETTHSHGLEGEHEHSGTAFTTWLDPTLAAAQARAIGDALAARWPEHSGRFEAQLEGLTQELTALDGEFQEAVAGDPELPLLFSHPVYQYLARRYHLDARSVHWEPDRMPDEAEWQELRTTLGEFPASWMIWEDTPLPEMSQRLESIGIRSVVFDPCANTPPSGDFLSVMGENLQALRLVFAASSLEAGQQ
jgi:zinc transport system substrate-binding protein